MPETPNLNFGALNNSLQGISEHSPAMAGGTTIFFRNYTTKNVVSFGATADQPQQFDWFETTRSSTTFVKKPPSPIIYPGITTSIVVYTTSSGDGLNHMRFMVDNIFCILEWQFDGFRRVIVDENVKYETKDGDRCFTCPLVDGIFLSSICGYDVWILELCSRYRPVTIDFNI